MRVSILGAGQMGTALGAPLMERGHEVRFWGPGWIDGPRLEEISVGEPHPDLQVALPGIAETTFDIEEAVQDADLVTLAVAAEGAEWVSEEAAKHAPDGTPVLVLSKGLVDRAGEVVSVPVRVREIFGTERPVVGVGGPVKAIDLIQNSPTQTVFAGEDRDVASLASQVSTSYYFPGTTDDLPGLGLCAALKNCYAIAFGYLAGDDAKANLRALAFGTALGEISAFVTAAGGRPETVAGAAGAGDLYVTCLSGRNGDFGRLLNVGNSPDEAIAEMNNATVEGLGTLPPALALARSLDLGEQELPLLYLLDEALRNPRPMQESSIADLLGG